MLAISIESQADLGLSVESFSETGEFPVRLLANASLDVFKAYRVFDDFENQPLHGAVLVDGNGLVRWQDIGYEPFTDAEFLLQESKRLLSQGTP